MPRLILKLCVVVAALSLAGVAPAQTFPSKPVRLVVPFTAGGAADSMARAIATGLTKSLGQPVVVENRPGAGTIIGADLVAKAAPDGHTLLFTNDSTYSINPLVYSKLPYNPKTDLAPVVAVAHLPETLIVNPELPVRNLREFIDYAKAHPGKLNYGSFGPASTPHLAAEGFKALTGVNLVHVPFKGGADLLPAILKGDVQAMFISPGAYLSNLRAGKLRALGTYAPARIAQLPDVPTFEEQGVRGLQMNVWFGFFTSGRTPDAVIQALADQIDRVVGDAEFRNQRLVPFTFVPAPPGREYFRQVLRADEERYPVLVRAANVKLD